MPNVLSKLGLLMPKDIYRDDMPATEQVMILKRELEKISSTRNGAILSTLVMSILEAADGNIASTEAVTLVIAAGTLIVMQHQSKKFTLLIMELEHRIAQDVDGQPVPAMTLNEMNAYLEKHCLLPPSVEMKVINAVNSIRNCFTWGRDQNVNRSRDAQDDVELQPINALNVHLHPRT